MKISAERIIEKNINFRENDTDMLYDTLQLLTILFNFEKKSKVEPFFRLWYWFEGFFVLG